MIYWNLLMLGVIAFCTWRLLGKRFVLPVLCYILIVAIGAYSLL